MKNIIKGLFMAALMSMAFTSCEDDAEIPDHGPAMHPEVETAGTYEGTWVCKVDGKTDEVADGTLVFGATDQAYISTLTASCPSFALRPSTGENVLTTNINITVGAGGYIFYNTVNTNGFGAIFQGTISKGGEVEIAFKQSVKKGLKTTVYNYTFNGVKLNN